MNIKSNKPNNPYPNKKLNEQDNDFFDAYLEGDSPLSEIYRNIDSAEPSNKLNQTILSTARASADKSSDSRGWWTQAGSWAASIAIISLVGILAHNTWQAEQDAMQQKTQKESLDALSQQGSASEPKPAAEPGKARMESDTQIEQSKQARTRAKKSMSLDNSKDSRKLLYKAAPAPVMQSAPAYFELNKTESLLKENQIQGFEDTHEKIQSSPEAKETKKESLTEPQILLNKIRQLIENNETVQAQELLLQFKTKYPDYPIDPVILKHLSPY